MKRIISLSGFGGSGKTACANFLFNQLEDAAIVESDQFFRIKPFEFITQRGREQIGRIKLRMSIALTTTFCDENIENIIIDGLVWSQAELDAVVEHAKKYRYEVWSFWLKTNKDIRHTRVIGRSRDETDSHEFLDLVDREIPDPTPLKLPSGHYHEIITDSLSTEEVAIEILRITDTGF